MNIHKITPINFRSANLNIASIADNHGDILGIPQVIKTIQANSDNIFEKKDEPSTQNVLAISGDFFMNPSKKGVLTHPDKTFGDIQYNFLLKLIYETKRLIDRKSNFSTLYTPGNHCYGGGDGWLYDKLLSVFAPLNMLLSNINQEKSPALSKVMRRHQTIKSEKVIEINDNKNPDIKNHVLFLGVTTPSMYYHPKGLKYTSFYDQTPKNESLITEKDLQETITVLNDKISAFKEKYPNGAVVILAHTGNKISNIIAENVNDINVILNAHDHKDYTNMVGKTLILSHGQNNKFIRGINIRFNDKGKLHSIKNDAYYTIPYIEAAKEDVYLQKFINKHLEKDLEPLIEFDDEITETFKLMYDDKMRYKNSWLANFITTAVKVAAKKLYPDVEIVGIPSTIIRSGLKSNYLSTDFNNIDLFNMFKGVDENVAGISKGVITGDELAKLIIENVKNNLKSPTRNALIQWSDIQINRTEIANNIASKNRSDLKRFIKIRDEKTGEFVPLKSDKTYCILLADKYLIKNNKIIKMPAKIINKFTGISESYGELFKQYIKITDKKIKLTDEIKEQRIL